MSLFSHMACKVNHCFAKFNNVIGRAGMDSAQHLGLGAGRSCGRLRARGVEAAV